MIELNEAIRTMTLTHLSHFIDIHKGKKGYVCGCGTSLNSASKEIINDGIVICCNAAGVYFDRYDYLIITDGSNPRFQYWDEVTRKADKVIVANPQEFTIYDDLKAQGKEVYLMTRKYHDRDNLRFDNEMLICGYDVCNVALHFAMVLGLAPITLYGIDLCYSEGKRYFNDIAAKLTGETVHPYLEQIAASEIDSDVHLSSSLGQWEVIVKQNKGIENRVMNGSQISRIPKLTKV